LTAGDYITLQASREQYGNTTTLVQDSILSIQSLKTRKGERGDPGGTTVDVWEDETPKAYNIDTLNMTGDVTVTDNGGGQVTVNVNSASSTANLLQVFDGTGGIDVNNSTAAPIPFDNETHKGSDYTHSTSSNASRVYVNQTATYKVTYNISYDSQDSSRKNIRCYARKNGSTRIVPSTSYSYVRNSDHDNGTNGATFLVDLSDGDYIEIMANREGDDFSDCDTISGESWLLMERM
jgi:hypothetical protein